MANNETTRESFWTRRARKKAIEAESKRKLDIEKKAIRAVLKENEKAAKAFLAECKRTKSKSEYDAMAAQCKRELKENKKWGDLEIACKTAESKYWRIYNKAVVDNHYGLFGRHRQIRANDKNYKANERFADYFRALENANPSDRRMAQIEKRELTAVSLRDFEPVTTLEEQKRILLGEQAEVTENENAREFMRTAFVLDASESEAADGWDRESEESSRGLSEQEREADEIEFF